jgi:hypothetical protein
MKNIQTKYKLNFKTMKKGLLTLLAASLVFVGCQNYDDQFDDLNTQISVLKSQIDGLASLSGQVSSLSSTISGLQAGVTAAQASADAASTAASAIDLSGLSASLATLQAEVDEVQASLATAATASAVAALQVELDALEADLDDLLVSNNVYATDITITDAASMASAIALGNKVALMNATVTITDASTVSDTDLQTFIDRIKTMNGNFVYSSGSTTGYAPTFDQMVSAKAITLTTAGDISFKALTSATTITINDAYTTKNTSLDMGALTSLTSFTNDDGDTNTIELTSATNVDLASLTRHTSLTGSPFTIITKKGATVDISSLDDVSTAGKQEDLWLTLNGASSYTSTNHAGGRIRLQNVATASVSGLYGTLEVLSGVETLTVVDGVRLDLDSASDLTTATLDFATDYDPDLTTANAAIAALGYSSSYMANFGTALSIDESDLETLTVTGQLLDLYLNGTSLETLSIDATIDALTISGTTDLTSLTVSSDSKIGPILLTGATNLKVADFNHTTNLTGDASTADKSTTFTVHTNAGLEKLHSTGDNVDTLNVYNNAALAELDFTGLKTDGSETTPSPIAYVYDNNLTATSSTNTKDGDTDVAAGKTTDLGAFDNGTSGMDTLQAYLDHVTATAASTAYVTFDKVSTLTNSESGTDVVTLNQEPSSSGILTTAATANETTVLMMVAAATSNATSDVAQKRAFVLDWASSGPIQLKANGVNLFDTTVGGAGTSLTIGTSNKDLQVTAIESAVNVSRATGANVTLDAKRGANSSINVSMVAYTSEGSTATVLGERYTTTTANAAAVSSTNFGLGLDDLFTLKVGSNSVTFSLGGQSKTTTGLDDIATAAASAYGETYGDLTTTAAKSAVATITHPNSGQFVVTSLQTDSGGYGIAVSLTVAGGTTTATNAKNIDYVIGDTKQSNDNSTTDADILVVLESTVKGVQNNSLGTVVTGTNGSASTWVELTTTYTNSSTSSYATQQLNRTDVRAAEDGTANTAASAVAFDRTAWIG